MVCTEGNFFIRDPLICLKMADLRVFIVIFGRSDPPDFWQNIHDFPLILKPIIEPTFLHHAENSGTLWTFHQFSLTLLDFLCF